MLRIIKALNKAGMYFTFGEGVAIEGMEQLTLAYGKENFHFENMNELVRLVDFKNMHLNKDVRYGLVIKDGRMFTDKGEYVDCSQFISSDIKEDKRRVSLSVGDLVKLRKCIHNNIIFALDKAIRVPSKSEYFTITRKNSDGSYTLTQGNVNVKVMSYMTEKAKQSIMSKTMWSLVDSIKSMGHKLVLDKEFNYLDISECGKFISYISSDRLERFEGEFWKEELRAKYSTSKKIRGVVKALFPEIDDNSMNTALMLLGGDNLKVEVIEGEDIYQVFKSSQNTDSGSLGNSCMLGKPREYFEIYRDNAKVAVLRNDSGKIICRAMLWELKNDEDKKTLKLMDRVYSTDDALVPLFKSWAYKNGYVTLRRDTHSESTYIDKNLKRHDLDKWFVPLKKSYYDSVPYVDTFYIKAGSRLYCSEAVCGLHSTGGGTSGL